MALPGSAWRSAPVALRHPVHRSRLLQLLARADGISFLEELSERGSRGFSNRVLELLGKVGERYVRMDRLDIAKKLVRKALGRALQRRDPVEHR
jgi:hypothetical protein